MKALSSLAALFLFLFHVPLAHAAEEKGWGEKLGELDWAQLQEAGSDWASLRWESSKLGNAISNKNLEAVTSSTSKLNTGLDDLAPKLKDLLGSEYSGHVDSVVERLQGNLGDIDSAAGQMDFDAARERFGDLTANWSSLESLATGQIPSMPEASETGWFQSAIDWATSWWSGSGE